MYRDKKNVDYQLDLTPFISLLSVCICFLLLTVVWFQVGALSIKQVMGTGSVGEKNIEITLWVYMKKEKKIELHLKKGNQSLIQKTIKPLTQGQFNFQEFNQYLVELKKQQSELKEVFILPQKTVIYEDIITAMDKLRQAGLFNMGLAPI